MSEQTNESVNQQIGRGTKVVVATSVMLTFISFWRAAAIVLNDLGSSAFYAGGIAEQAIGKAAPWFILGVMLFSYAVRAIYVESCGMFTRGGVYKVVKEAMGASLGKLSVSALMFDYILTGPISGVSAGQYIIGLVAQTTTYLGHPWNPSKNTVNLLAAAIATLIILYFWWRNTKGIHESSEDALKIMYVTTAMVVVLIIWGSLTILTQPDKQKLPPAPLPHNLSYHKHAAGWMPSIAPTKFSVEPSPHVEGEEHFKIAPDAGALFGLIGIFIALGHSILAMSGEESLAQVNRELEYPKHKNLVRAGMVIFIYSLLFTSLVSFFAYAIIPDAQRHIYYDNLISGIAMNVVGPLPLRLIFQGFIVIVGFLMLAGAANTAIIGSNGVLNRLSEDGVLTDWFRAPHKKFGTTYRMINLIVILQIVTVIASRGNVYILGEAYAFGVVWSFAFKGLAMLVLRFKNKSPREWKVPFNINIGQNEIPIGLGIIATLLFSLASINLITKQIATISGVALTLVFFVIFLISERINERQRGDKSFVELDQFRLHPEDTISQKTLGVRPNNVICLVRDYNTLSHLKHALEITHTGEKDFVVVTIRLLKGPDSGYEGISEEELFTNYEQKLFSRVVSVAENSGKHVELLVVPSTDVFEAIIHTVMQLHSSEIIAGRSSIMPPQEQARRLGNALEKSQNKPKHTVRFTVIDHDGSTEEFYLGAHAPELTEEDINLIHQLWLDLSMEGSKDSVHHSDVVRLALTSLKKNLTGPNRKEFLNQLNQNKKLDDKK